MLRRTVIVTLIVLLPVLAVGLAAAGSNTQSTATDVGPGSHDDSTASGEDHWYHVAVPEGKVLQLSLAITAGDTWNSLRLYDSEGASVGYVENGETQAYEPGEGDAWFVMSTYWSSSSYTFTVSFTNATPQDDAGSGHDAGQRQSAALPVQPGQISGTARYADGDVADWYRVDVPAGLILDVTGANVWVGVYSSSGAMLGSAPPYASRTFSTLSDGTPIFLRVSYAESYVFTLATAARSDLRVDSVASRTLDLVTEQGPTGVAYAREVSVTLSNVGAGASRSAHLEVLALHDGPTGHRVVGERDVTLAPGEQIVVTLPWDTTGEVGDVTLWAHVTGQFDAVAANNEGREQTFVLAGGSPVDVDLLNHQVQAGSTTLGTEYGGDRIGLDTPAGFVGYDHGTLLLP